MIYIIEYVAFGCFLIFVVFTLIVTLKFGFFWLVSDKKSLSKIDESRMQFSSNLTLFDIHLKMYLQSLYPDKFAQPPDNYNPSTEYVTRLVRDGRSYIGQINCRVSGFQSVPGFNGFFGDEFDENVPIVRIYTSTKNKIYLFDTTFETDANIFGATQWPEIKANRHRYGDHRPPVRPRMKKTLPLNMAEMLCVDDSVRLKDAIDTQIQKYRDLCELLNQGRHKDRQYRFK